MTKTERELCEGLVQLTDCNRAYFLTILRCLQFAQTQLCGACGGEDAEPAAGRGERRQPS